MGIPRSDSDRKGDALTAAREAAGEVRSFEAVREVGALDRLPMILARHARAADLVIVGEPDRGGGTDDTVLVEAAFMETGRPALVVPQAGARRLPPRRVLVAWDGSREAARAVQDGLPLIRLAEEVIILTADAERHGQRVGAAPGADLAVHLGRHGVAARVEAAQSGGLGVAGLILDQAEKQDVDLIVMGGYGHARLREMMLGGVTRQMLERMTLPVLFSH